MAEQPASVAKTQTQGVSKIGLALSGGGFRASIFHLGVIRRLEELGIMKDVNVISTVSGGSIIGAYYVCEMEKRLRSRRQEITAGNLDAIRLEIFESIAEDFFRKIKRNLRSRALVFGPIFHPPLFVKSLWPGVTRSDLIQAEFDRCFFGGTAFTYGRTLGDLPSVTREASKAETTEEETRKKIFSGPEMIINTTSLLTGGRVSFSRQSISGVRELSKVDTNTLTLARVVGASAGVPGLFPPTTIGGDLLVDGGVSDNQGLDGLLEEGRKYDGQSELSRADYNLILVSDASGQIEQLNTLSPRFAKVLPRTLSVLQHEIRNKVLKRLILWHESREKEWECDEREPTEAGHVKEQQQTREFAFVHLFLNLKERGVSERVPSEYIPALGRVRTDLDQFSMIERECLMYHGYTLIDAQLRKWCGNALTARGLDPESLPALRRPPLFRRLPRPASDTSDETARRNGEDPESEKRSKVQQELQVGAKAMFVLRSMIHYRWRAIPIVLLLWLGPLCLYGGLVHGRVRDALGGYVESTLAKWWGCGPGWLHGLADWLLGEELVGAVGQALLRIVIVLLPVLLILYLAGFVTYLVMRRLVRGWDRKQYQALTGEDYKVHWSA